MRIFNQDKTKEILDYSYGRGRLQSDTLKTGMTEEIPEIKEEGHYETIREYPNGGKDVEWIIDKPGQEYKAAEPIYEDIQVFIPYTLEELFEVVRLERENLCFYIINRSPLWYNTLNSSQLKELDTWYHEWLDVTKKITLGIDYLTILPKKPEWLK